MPKPQIISEMKVKTAPESAKQTPQGLRKMIKILRHFRCHPTTKRLKIHSREKGHSDTAKAQAV